MLKIYFYMLSKSKSSSVTTVWDWNYDISINIIDDAMDVLVFDQNTIQPYDLGQSYRSSYEQIPSTESALGSYSFHWKVPASINQKTWYIVFDNLDHDGDQGEMMAISEGMTSGNISVATVRNGIIPNN